MGELRSQELTIAGWIINLPLATVGHHTGGPSHPMDRSRVSRPISA